MSSLGEALKILLEALVGGKEACKKRAKKQEKGVEDNEDQPTKNGLLGGVQVQST